MPAFQSEWLSRGGKCTTLAIPPPPMLTQLCRRRRFLPPPLLPPQGAGSRCGAAGHLRLHRLPGGRQTLDSRPGGHQHNRGQPGACMHACRTSPAVRAAPAGRAGRLPQSHCAANLSTAVPRAPYRRLTTCGRLTLAAWAPTPLELYAPSVRTPAGWLGRRVHDSGAGCAAPSAGCAAANPQLRPRTAPAGAYVFNPLNHAVVRRLAHYNRALRCKWERVAAWNCTTCLQVFAPGSTRLLASYLTKANVPGFDPERGVVVTSQDKVNGWMDGRRWRPALLRALRLRAALQRHPARLQSLLPLLPPAPARSWRGRCWQPAAAL